MWFVYSVTKYYMNSGFTPILKVDFLCVDFVTDMDFSPFDGRILATGSYDCSVSEILIDQLSTCFLVEEGTDLHV